MWEDKTFLSLPDSPGKTQNHMFDTAYHHYVFYVYLSFFKLSIKQDGASATYNQIKFERNLKRTENEAVYNYNFNTPKYHIVYNEQQNTEFGVPRAYR